MTQNPHQIIGREAPPLARPTRAKVLMIVDDDRAVRTMLVETLQDDRYQVLAASDGDEAIEIAKREPPDLILLDVKMPGKNGIEVCRELRAHGPTAHVKVVMISGLGGQEARRESLAAGADDFISKPYSPLALIQAVEHYLDL